MKNLVMSYVDQPPNFEKVIRVHTATKHSTLNEFKQPSTAAALLGISEKTFARVTGAVLVSNDNDTDSIRKINIGLQLKLRGVVSKSKFSLPFMYRTYWMCLFKFMCDIFPFLL